MDLPSDGAWELIGPLGQFVDSTFPCKEILEEFISTNPDGADSTNTSH